MFAAPRVIPVLLRQHGAWAFALIVSSWVVRGELAEGVRPSEDPRRVEAVVVTVCDRTAHEAWIAAIERRSQEPPRLGEWQRATALGGLLVEPLRRVLPPQE